MQIFQSVTYFVLLNNSNVNGIMLICNSEVETVKNKSYDKAIENAVASVEMEGYQIDEQSKEWCKKLLLNEITMDEYIEFVKLKAGVTA